VAGLVAELALERAEKGLEEVHEEGVGAPHDVADFGVHQSRENQGPPVPRGGGVVDARHAFLGLGDRVDEGQGHLLEIDALELGEQAVPEHLDRDAGPVGDKKCRSAASSHVGPGKNVPRGRGPAAKITVCG